MKLVKRETKLVGAVALILIASPLVMASEPGWYVGGDVGRSSVKLYDDKITSSVLGSGFTTSSISESESEHDTAYKAFGGYQFNDYFALESGYFDLGRYDFTATTVPAGTLGSDIKLKGLNFDTVGIIPFTKKFSAFGRIGLTYVETRDAFGGTGAVTVIDPHPKKNNADYKFGLGLQYDFTESLGMRIEAERYRIRDAVGDNGDVDVASVGVIYRFGQTKHAVKPDPAPVAATPAPEPKPELVAVVPEKNIDYCSVLDIQFEINRGAIQDEEKEKLAVLGRFMTKYPDTTAVIEGHTDDVGTMKYNQKLSQQRADNVVKYLVDDLHVSSSRLKAVGYGEGNPQSSNADSAGKQANRRIDAVISCATDVEGLAVAYPRITMAMVIDFDPLQSTIEPKYYDGLNKVADYMITHPAIVATVEGHSAKYNGVGNAKVEVSKETSKDISEHRANIVVEYLVSKGVARNRLAAAAFGQSRRVAYGTTLAGQQENRRVNIIFNYPGN